jgi:hypothetical protein
MKSWQERLRGHKEVMREFMRMHYTDERLVWLLAHAQSGKLAFNSCCCFIGIVTADHALRGEQQGPPHPMEWAHYEKAKWLPGAEEAEYAFMQISDRGMYRDRNAARRRILIAMVKAEIRVRERGKQPERCRHRWR